MTLNRRNTSNLNGQTARQAQAHAGGIPVGCAHAGGIYSGYTMVACDDFNGSLNIVRPGAPLNRYPTTHGYGAGARSFGGTIIRAYDMDPYHTGWQDSNRGVPVGSNNLTQTNSVLAMKVRAANAGETAHVNSRTIVGAMIHTGGYLTASPPCIIEARIAHTAPATNPHGWHPTFWVLSASPFGANVTPSLEFDFPECSSQWATANVNIGGSPTGWTTDSTSLQANNLMGTGYHTYSLVITAASVLFYVDGSLVKTESHDGTVCARPYFWLLTCHTLDGGFAGDTGVDLSGWAASGDTGATMFVDYYRVWVPSSPTPVVLTPPPLPTLQVAYNTSMTYTFPTLAALWGSGFSGADYCGACKNEDYAPGTDAQANFIQFPAGLSFNSGTRVLSGVTTDKKPGRIHTICTPYLSTGCLGYVARGYIDVGPVINTGAQNLTNGATYTHDLYTECDVGDLLPKVITVGTLPAGLTFDGVSTISGTPTVNAVTSVPVTVSNSSGQSVTTNVSFTVAAIAALAIEGAVTNTSSASTTVTGTISTTKTNVVLCAVFNRTTGITVSSVTSTSGLTWTKRVGTGTIGSGIDSWEYWTAPAASALTSEVVTVTFSASTSIRMFVFGVAGCGNIAAPFDVNVGVPATHSTNAQTTISATCSTTYTNDMLLCLIRADSAMGTITKPTGFTEIVAAGSSFYELMYKVVSSAQTSLTVTTTWTSTANAGVIVDALKGN